MATSPLLDLPAELRLFVYHFVLRAVPLAPPRDEYAGLLYSCRFVYQELGAEILKRMGVFLVSRQVRCQAQYEGDLLFKMPQTLEELYNLQVWRPLRPKMFSRDDPFMAVMYLHFTSLTITTRCDANANLSSPSFGRRCASVVYDENRLRLGRWIETCMSYTPASVMDRIVYDLSLEYKLLSRPLTSIHRDLFAGTGHWRQVTWKILKNGRKDIHCEGGLVVRTEYIREGKTTWDKNSSPSGSAQEKSDSERHILRLTSF